MSVEDYMKLPYTRVIVRKRDGSGSYYYGYIKELNGCQSTGVTRKELDSYLDEAMELWLEVAIENGLSIPMPESCCSE